MSAFVWVRLGGLVVFALIGSRIGSELAAFTELSASESSAIFLGLGALVGLLIAPWITITPWRSWRRLIREVAAGKLALAVLGGMAGLMVALMLAYPLSLIGDPVGQFAPVTVSLAGALLGMSLFSMRAPDIIEGVSERISGRPRRVGSFSARQLLLDTSVLIDGRIVEIAETGFIGGTLIIPRFVLSELHRVADSSDSLRRNRGRRGLAKLNELQRNNDLPVKIIDEDPQEFDEVDAKLVALSIQLNAALVTNDFNLNQVADAQGVDVLNINELANAVRSVYIPGETFAIRIIQQGRDPNQGVGYLDDGTMVVVESGQKYMDRNVGVEVTKLINRPTGRMIFAVPENRSQR